MGYPSRTWHCSHEKQTNQRNPLRHRKTKPRLKVVNICETKKPPCWES